MLTPRQLALWKAVQQAKVGERGWSGNVLTLAAMLPQTPWGLVQSIPNTYKGPNFGNQRRNNRHNLVGAGIVVGGEVGNVDTDCVLFEYPVPHRAVFARYKRLNNSVLLKRCFPYVIAALFLPLMGYVFYLLGLEILNGVRETGFVWILQGVLVFAAVGFFSAKGSLLLWKPPEECTHHPRNLRQRYVGVFRDGLEFGIVGLLVGLATGDRAAADEAAFAFGTLGIILSIIGETIRCFRHLKPNPPPPVIVNAGEPVYTGGCSGHHAVLPTLPTSASQNALDHVFPHAPSN